MIAILAGRGFLGAEAPCRTFTISARVEEILNKLPRSFELENHRMAFWVLVSMNRIINGVTDPADFHSLRSRRRTSSAEPRLPDAATAPPAPGDHPGAERRPTPPPRTTSLRDARPAAPKKWETPGENAATPSSPRQIRPD